MQDVLVVGGGPAGNNAAARLAELGYGVDVLDWRHDLGDKLCSGIVGLACTQLRPLDPSIVYREALSATVFSPSGRPLHFGREEPQAYVVDRVRYVASIAQAARQAGAAYYLGHRVTAIDIGSDRVLVHCAHQEGRHTHQARIMVLASGFGSHFTRPLGLGWVADYAIGVQAEVEAPDLDEVQVYLGRQVSPGFFAWLVPTIPGRALVGLMTRQHSQAHLERLLERLRQQGQVGALVKGPAQWGIPLRPLLRTYADRLLVVGDAAGQVKPTTGGGIFYSLVTSDIAAEVASEALQCGDLSARQLSAYQQRWKEVLHRELEVGYAARRLYERLGDRQVSFLMKLVGPTGLHRQLVNMPASAFDWHSNAVNRILRHPVIGPFLRLLPGGGRHGEQQQSAAQDTIAASATSTSKSAGH